MVLKNKAFTLLELLVAMGIMMILVALGMAAILNLQKRARDTDRTKALAEIAGQINNYKRANLSYPENSEVSFSGTEVLIVDSNYSVVLKGATRSGVETSSSETRYYYSKDEKGFSLCALLESGKIDNLGTNTCPDVNNW